MSTLKPNNSSMSSDGNDKANVNVSSPASKRRNGPRGAQSGCDATTTHQAKRGGQSLNHLLSFTLPPRSRPALSGPARRSRRGGGSGGGSSVPFSKERYVNAQYRFLVKPTGDYTACFADPDIYLDWADILQVVIPTSSVLAGVGSSAPILDQPREPTHEGAACPICLSPPTAPRMTKCGHVFCFPCILHYLSLTDDKATARSAGNSSSRNWRRCPICSDAVYATDLKAVRWWDAQAASKEHAAKVREEQELEEARRISQMDSDHEAQPVDKPQTMSRFHSNMLALRLIERPHVTTLALPQSSTWPASELDHPLIAAHSAPWHFQPDVMGFAKFMLATPDLLIESLSQDLRELEEEIKVLTSFGADALGLQFVRVAQHKVAEQIQKVQTELDLPVVRSAIGQAKNDLKDHEAAQAGKLQRADLSRRQRKRMERAQTDEERDTGGRLAATPPLHKNGEARTAPSQTDAKPSDAAGVEELLALHSHAHGGRTASGHQTPRRISSKCDARHDETERAPSVGQQKVRKNVNARLPGSSAYVFFQAASGQNIFLHPLDTKILLSHYGGYATLPRNLVVKMSGADEGSMNDELRRRCKYLNHIPMAADVVFIEVDWEGMDLISKWTLRPYEQALRQRRNKRRDKERREDSAKSRAEEAEKISNQGGAAAAAAYRQRQAELAAFTSEANLVPDALPRSFDGHRSGCAMEKARMAEAHSDFQGGWVSFGESALMGAERAFPIHRGAATEEFPDSLGGVRNDFDRVWMCSDDLRAHEEGERTAEGPWTKKTVWGTPASKSSFAQAIQGRGGDAYGMRDDQMEDAWHELEEDYILGSTGSGRRPTAAVREGRGLNKQNRIGGGGAWRSSQPSSVTPSGAQTPKRREEHGPRGDVETSRTAAEQAGVIASAQESRSKKAKKKLILTGGGGGRGSR